MLRLSRTQRSSLLAGNAPFIGGPGEAPCVKGDVYTVTSRLSIEVLRVDVRYQSGGARWSVHYLVRDTRDPVRIPKRTPSISEGDFGRMRRERDQHGYPLPVDEGVASELSSYTTGGRSAITDAGESVSRDVQEAQTQAAKERRTLGATLSIDARLAACKSLEERIVELQRLADRHNIRAKPEFRHVNVLLGRDDRLAARILDGVEQRVRRKAA